MREGLEKAGHLYIGGVETARSGFHDRSRRLAAVLRNLGVGSDDAVGVLLYNDTLYLEVVEACRFVGAHYVTLNWHGSAAEITNIMQDAAAKVLIGHSNLTAKFQHEHALDLPILSATLPDDVIQAYGVAESKNDGQIDLEAALRKVEPLTSEPLRTRGIMPYTSGSTGRPKGIRRTLDLNRPDSYETYKNLASVLLQLQPGDRFYTPAPLYHSAPNVLTSICIASQSADVFLRSRFDAEQFLADIEQFQITHCYIVPTMMVRMLKLPQEVRERYDTSSLRYSISTGSSWPHDVKAAMIDWFGPIFYETYGASEIGFMTLISSAEAQQRPGSVGKVLPGGSIKIIDDQGLELEPGETGSIYVHLPMFGEFSYSNIEGDMAGLRHGQHVTVGDVGHLDDDGYLYISDRKKDMIISGGANIFPAEIEAAILEMPQVLDCAVFGAPHAEFGESVVAALQLAEGQSTSQAELEQFLVDKIAKFKIPRLVEFHTELPREDSGKIFKQKLREPHWQNYALKI